MTEETNQSELSKMPEMPELHCDAVEMLDKLTPPFLGVIVIDRNKKSYISTKLRTNLGYLEESIGLEKILPQTDRKDSAKDFDIFINKPGASWETAVLCKDQSRIPVKVENVQWSSSEKPEYTLLFVRDTTKETKDELTGLLNRRTLISELAKRVEEAKRYNSPLSIAMMDIDYFKFYNDHCIGGHDAGDSILKFLAGILSNNGQVRADDFVGRWGGEEFVIVFPMTTHEDALIAIERIREQFRKNTSHQVKAAKDFVVGGQILAKAGELVPVTATFGLLSLDQMPSPIVVGKEDDELAKEVTTQLTMTIDDLMRYGKEHGRNRAVSLRDLSDDEKIEYLRIKI